MSHEESLFSNFYQSSNLTSLQECTMSEKIPLTVFSAFDGISGGNFFFNGCLRDIKIYYLCSS